MRHKVRTCAVLGLLISSVALAQPASYREARASFRSQLTRNGPAPGATALPPAPPGLETVSYPSGELVLRAWLSVPAAARSKPAPAVVFFHGGFELGAGTVEMARPFLDRGFVTLFPTLRGENGNLGHFELLLGEIDDAAAAVRWIASQPYVDPARVYAYGHSMGARVALLLSLRDDVALRIAGGSAGLYTADGLARWGERAPFDVRDERERRMRAPFGFLDGMGQRHLAFVGRQEYSAERVAEFRQLAAGSKLEVHAVDGDHMSCLRPAVAAFLRAVTEAPRLRFRPGPAIGSSWTMHGAFGDFDRDGDLDLFETDYGQPNRVFLNDGRGSFTDSGQLLGCSAGHAAALADFDSDGDLDVFVANTEDQPNVVWLNDGKGAFDRSPQQLEKNDAMCVAKADFDGDGDVDVVVGRFGKGAEVHSNDGRGQFTPSGLQLGGTVAGVAAGDVDDDGDIDLLTAGWSDRPDVPGNAIWLNQGDLGFRLAQQLDEPGRRVHSGASLADLDGDGDLDAVLAFGGGDLKAAIWLNGGRGRFERVSQIPGAGGIHGLALADLDRDGDLDLVLAGRAPNTVWLNDGHGAFADSGLRLDGALSSSVAIADLDGDGAPDIVFAESDPSQPGSAAPNHVWTQEAAPHPEALAE